MWGIIGGSMLVVGILVIAAVVIDGFFSFMDVMMDGPLERIEPHYTHRDGTVNTYQEREESYYDKVDRLFGRV